MKPKRGHFTNLSEEGAILPTYRCRYISTVRGTVNFTPGYTSVRYTKKKT